MNDLASLFSSIDEKAKPVYLDDGFFEWSGRTDTDFVPGIQPQGKTLRSYQRAAVETMLKFRRGILGFPPGLGKSLTALTAIANLGGKTVFIIPPALAYDPWQVEIETCFPQLKFQILTGQKPRKIDEDLDIVIIGDSVVAYWVDAINNWAPENLVIDEAQRHKSRKAKRAKATLEIAEFIRAADGAVFELTGTIATNHAEEVWMPANIAGIASTIAGSSSYNKWCSKWCYLDQMAVTRKLPNNEEETIWIKKASGCTDPIGLHDALRQTAYIRVEREDVTDMPDKLIVKHAMATSKKELQEYNHILNDFENWLAENGGEGAVERVSGSEKIVQLGKLVEQAALTRMESCAEYVAALVEQGEQIVVMAHHKSVVRAFVMALDALKVSSATFVGDDSPKRKTDNLTRFKAGQIDVLVGNIKSAGTGLNLENSANLVFVQFPWSAGDFEQTSDRIYRVTQTRECTIHMLYAAGTIDAHVMEVLEKKAVVTQGINAGVYNSNFDDESGSIVDDVFEMML